MNGTLCLFDENLQEIIKNKRPPSSSRQCRHISSNNQLLEYPLNQINGLSSVHSWFQRASFCVKLLEKMDNHFRRQKEEAIAALKNHALEVSPAECKKWYIDKWLEYMLKCIDPKGVNFEE